MKRSRTGAAALVEEKNHRRLCLIVFLFSAALASGAVTMASTAQVEGASSAEDPRFLPWLGCWERLVENDSRDDEESGEVLLCMTPSAQHRGVTITTFEGGEAVLEKSLVADGERHTFEESGCQGWRAAHWSRQGRRLFILSEMECDDGIRRSSSGVSLFVPNGDWMDVHVFRSGEEREVVMARYRPSGSEPEAATLPPQAPSETALARRRASRLLTLDEVAEACAEIDPAAVEVVLLESEAGYELDAERLRQLADSRVPDEIIDLLLALSFPDRFVITHAGALERPPVEEGTELAGLSRYAQVYPYHFADPYFDPFGYSHYYIPHDPFFFAPPQTGGEQARHGRVVKGRGYTQVESRPDPGSSSRGRSSNAGSGGSTSGGSSGGGSASPGGYSRGGGSSGGRTAQPRGH